MKLLVIGHAKHGKDTLCEFLHQDHGLSFVSSSYFAAERAVRPALAAQGLVYPDLASCFADRARHRPLWKQAIEAYNTPDPTRLCREMMAGHDIYCGLRSRREFEACMDEEVFDAVAWVDRSALVGPEPLSSMELTERDADYLVDNNRDLHDLRRNAGVLMGQLKGLLG